MKLTIGMTVFDDWDGFYFTIQSIRMHHKDALEHIEFVVINTNPNSSQGKEVENFCKAGWIKEPLHYYNDDNSMGTATRSKIFDYAQTPYVLVLDSHVLLPLGAVSSLINFFDRGLDEGNLIHGPMLFDSLEVAATHMDQTWGGGMLGKWKIDDHYKTDDFFEIPAHGMGLFACRKSAWLGFNKKHTGFGGEENTIHEKFRQNGKKSLCLSELKWLHRFQRPKGVPYSNKWEDRVKNYFRSFLELDKPVYEIMEHYISIGIDETLVRKWLQDVIKEDG